MPDFPVDGVLFRDITPLLARGDLFQAAIREMAGWFKDTTVDIIAGVEARGFCIGAAIAFEMGVGFVPIRKIGKLPRSTHRATYALEYGESAIEIHRDALDQGDQVLVVDDVLATGGTMGAAIRLVEDSGASVAGTAVLIELKDLGARARIGPHACHALIQY